MIFMKKGDLIQQPYQLQSIWLLAFVNKSQHVHQYQLFSIHNPVNINASNICFHLINQYHGTFDTFYTNCKKQWLVNGRPDINNFDKIELLTVHFYDDAIAERKEERSIKGVRLIRFQEKNLHSMNDYVSAL
ncbi:hypothetical protein Glove_82g26 [Diversispora epigaea]|uniref:Uncharacterized protein n=1 Tax=Diversispora epigaea TaxID=1348612 RepID=A0A397JC71_9GLOM|nr:hypothetical protein Glove_82g26 [Diversispora epigaea]